MYKICRGHSLQELIHATSDVCSTIKALGSYQDE